MSFTLKGTSTRYTSGLPLIPTKSSFINSTSSMLSYHSAPQRSFTLFFPQTLPLTAHTQEFVPDSSQKPGTAGPLIILDNDNTPIQAPTPPLESTSLLLESDTPTLAGRVLQLM